MKTKVVLWGANAQDEKVLIALQLRPEANMVDVWTFPEQVATEAFSKQMMNEWRDNKEVEFPENTHIERELSVTEHLLPADLKVERTDVIERAKTEWHFMVLSSKLHQTYEATYDELKEEVSKLESFSQDSWDRMKEFWNKVQEQVRERNLLRHQGDELRSKTNELFDQMKALRGKMDEEFRAKSKNAMDSFMGTLDKIEGKAAEGMRLKPLFDELKSVQRKYRDTKMTREHANKVWARLDNSFKMVKGKLFGEDNQRQADGNSPLQRTQRRLNGLLAAIDKMERSLNRDKDELSFQERKIATTDGQLEAQIRQAKIMMIQERLRSKEEKFEDMMKTKVELEGRIEKERINEEKRKARQEQDKAKKAAEAAVKARIAEQMKEGEAAISAEDAEKLAAAAATIKATKEKAAAAKAAAMAAAATTSEEIVTETVPTETATETVPTEAATETPVADAPVEKGILEEVTDMASEALEDAVDTAKAIATVVIDRVTDALEGDDDTPAEETVAASPTTEPATEVVTDAASDAVDTATAIAAVVSDNVAEAVADLKNEEE